MAAEAKSRRKVEALTAEQADVLKMRSSATTDMDRDPSERLWERVLLVLVPIALALGLPRYLKRFLLPQQPPAPEVLNTTEEQTHQVK